LKTDKTKEILFCRGDRECNAPGLFLCKKERNISMSTITIKKSTNESIGRTYYLCDPRLSLKAKGLMSQLLWYPRNSDFDLDALTYHNQDGEKSIRSAIQDLQKHGYLERWQKRNNKGQLLPVEYTIYENPYEGMDEPEEEFYEDYHENNYGNYNPPPENAHLHLVLDLVLEILTELINLNNARSTERNQSQPPQQQR